MAAGLAYFACLAMVPAMIVSLLGALWSASGAAGNLITAVNRAYDEEETRGFLKVRGTAR